MTKIADTELFKELASMEITPDTLSNYDTNILLIKNHSDVQYDIKISSKGGYISDDINGGNASNLTLVHDNPTKEYIANTNTTSVTLTIDPITETISDHFVFEKGLTDNDSQEYDQNLVINVTLPNGEVSASDVDQDYVLGQANLAKVSQQSDYSTGVTMLVNTSNTLSSTAKFAERSGFKSPIVPLFSYGRSLDRSVYNPNFDSISNEITLTALEDSTLFGNQVIINHSDYNSFIYLDANDGRRYKKVGLSVSIPGIAEHVKLVTNAREYRSWNSGIQYYMLNNVLTDYPENGQAILDYLQHFSWYEYVYTESTDASGLFEFVISGTDRRNYDDNEVNLVRLELIIHPEDVFEDQDGHPVLNLGKNRNVLVGEIHKDYKVFTVVPNNPTDVSS